MADVPVLNAAESDAPPRSKKWLIIGIIAFLTLAGGGVGAWLLLGQNDSHGKKVEQRPKDPPAPPLYVALDPPFVVNLRPSRYAESLRQGDTVRVRMLPVYDAERYCELAGVVFLQRREPAVRQRLDVSPERAFDRCPWQT